LEFFQKATRGLRKDKQQSCFFENRKNDGQLTIWPKN